MKTRPPPPASSPPPGPVRVMLVEDHLMMRSGLRLLVGGQPGFTITGEAGDGATALAQAALAPPDLMIVDIHLPGEFDGIELTRRLLRRHPEIRIIILSADDQPANIRAALLAGAAGYLLKENTCDELLRAIRTVLRGRQYLSPGILGA